MMIWKNKSTIKNLQHLIKDFNLIKTHTIKQSLKCGKETWSKNLVVVKIKKRKINGDYQNVQCVAVRNQDLSKSKEVAEN